MGDEFALVDPATGLLHAFPRAVSLKNEAIDLFPGLTAERWGPPLAGTPKGMIRHLRPNPEAIVRMAEPARPALLLFPRYGFREEVREIGQAEIFVRMTQASTNYVNLGEAGFAALTRFVGKTPARAVDYPDGPAAMALVERLWQELAG